MAILSKITTQIRRAPSLPLLLALPACLVPLLWAESGALIQTGDYNNPINADRAIAAIFDGWQQDNLGEPSFRQTPFLFPYLAFWWAGDAAGLAVATVQRLWLISLFGLALVAAWSLLRVIAPRAHRHSVLAALALLAYAFNPFTLTYWAIGYHIAFLAYAVAPLWLAEMARVLTTRASWTGGVRVGVASFLFASAFSNPPSVVIMIVLPTVVLAGLLVVKSLVPLKRIVGRVAAIVPWLVALNAWWLVPVMTGLTRSGYSYAGASWDLFEYPTFTNPVPIREFIRGTGFWGLHTGYQGVPYFEWAIYLDEPLVVAATLWLAACALVPLTRRRWWSLWTIAAATMFILGVFLSKGINAPLGDVNRWLYTHVPGFFMFRGTEKFAGLQFLSILIGLGILLRWARWKAVGYWAFCVVTTAAIGLSSWPLIIGTVVQPENRAGVSDEIEIPGYYEDLKSWTQRERPTGSLLVVPQSPTGYLKTTWGFAGADLVHHYSVVPVVTGAPEARPADGSRFAAYLRAAESFDQVKLLVRLGISHVLVRGDIDTTYYPGTPSPESVEERLKDSGFIWVKAIGPLQLYAVPADSSPIRASTAILAATDLAPGARDRILSGTTLPIAGTEDPLPFESVLDACVVELPTLDEDTEADGQVCDSRHSALSGEVLFARLSFTGRRETDGPRLSVSLLLPETAWANAGRNVRNRDLDVRLDEDVAAVRLESMILSLKRGSAISGAAAVNPSTTLKLLADSEQNLIVDGSFESGSLAGLGQIGSNATDASLRLSDDASAGRRSAELRVSRGASFVTRDVTNFDPAGAYVVGFDYRHVEGAPPAFGVWQIGGDSYATEKRNLATSPGWHHYEHVFLAEPGARGLRVFLYAFAQGKSDPTVNRYDNLVVRRLSPAGTVRIGELLDRYASMLNWRALALPRTASSDSPAPRAPSPLVEDGSFEDSPWGGAFPVGSEPLGRQKARLSSDASEGRKSLELIATEGGAAVSQRIRGFDPESRYRLSFRYKHIEGEPPAFGVWAGGVERYAHKNFALSTDAGWHEYEATINPPAESKSLNLFFYSFANSDQPTRNRYDDVEIVRTPVQARLLIREAQPQSEHAPTVTIQRNGGASVEGVVRDLDGEAWILYAQAFDQDWVLEAKALNGSQVNVGAHLRVDGFSNAWQLSGRGDVKFTIVHRGAFRTRAAVGVSGGVIVFLALAAALHRRGRIPRRLRRPLYGWRAPVK